MRRHRDLTSTTRASRLARPLDEVWGVVASGRRGPSWAADALPFVVRGAVDRLLGGGGRRWEAPGTPLLHTGDRLGFWTVVEAEHDGPHRRLLLRADVRAPGRVQLDTTAHSHDGATEVVQVVRFTPDGLLGAAYLLADLPARELVAELAHRALRRAIA